jgi:spermidine/putrescine transport system permease protein
LASKSEERAEEGTTERRRARVVPYVMATPGLGWLALFFVLPLATLFVMSLSERESRFDFSPDFAWKWSNYSDALSQFDAQFLRSFQFAGIATIAAVIIGYPLAYFIAFRGGRASNLLLGLVVVPLFTTYLVRTLAWKSILADEGWVVGFLRDVGVLGADGRLLSTSWAVIGGLTYNFLPFMVLPIYVSLEKIDPALVEAAQDLYSSSWRAFRKVVLPLSLPGVFAGGLLTFIPAAGDFVNSQFLGSARTTMIGNVIQGQFLVQLDYPKAAALSFILMAIILVAVLVYARVLGTEELIS